MVGPKFDAILLMLGLFIMLRVIIVNFTFHVTSHLCAIGKDSSVFSVFFFVLISDI